MRLIVSFLIVAAGLAGHGTRALAEQPTRLTVGVYQNEPKIFQDAQGEVLGFFPEILATIADEHGYQTVYRRCEWTDCLDMLAAGEIDVMPDVAFSRERAARFRFGETPALHSWSYFYVRPGRVLRRLADLDGARIAALEGSIQAQRLRNLSESQGFSITLVPTASHEETFERVEQGAVDVGVVNHLFGERAEVGSPLIRAQLVFNAVSLYFAFPPDAPGALIDSFDVSLARMATDPRSVYFDAHGRWLTPPETFRVPVWLGALAGVVLAGLLLAGAFTIVLRNRVEAATRALRDSNRKLEEAQRLARIGDFRWDQNDDSVAWSAHMRSMLGYRDDDAISLDLIRRKVHHPDDAERVMSWITSGIEGGAERLGPEVYRLVRKSGETIWVEANLRIDRSAGRKPVVFGTCQDITARVEMERALLEAKAAAEQAANAKSTFLASVSHELRTPLNAIIGFTDLLQETAAPTLSAKQREQLSNVQAAARQLYELVDNVLELTNAEQIDFRVQPTTFSLGECVERALAQVDFLAAQRGIRIHNRMAEGADVDCYADEFRTRQVLVNLLTNAVKYNRQGGSVTIAPAEATKGHVRLNVTDTGEGIPEDLLGVIFNIFSRLNVDPMVAGDGTGVGLTIAKRLVERMDGRIGVESAVGAGSTFWIELPAAPGPDS